jgi:hypothetical protein
VWVPVASDGAGADEALWVLGWLDGDSRSLRESEMRSSLVFAGLPAPESNVGAVAAATPRASATWSFAGGAAVGGCWFSALTPTLTHRRSTKTSLR